MIFREVEDRDLIAKARRGHVEAYNVLVSRWEKRVFNYLLRLVRHREDALDLGQDVFLKAYQNLKKLEDPERFPAWLFRIAHNEAYSLLRKNRPEGEIAAEFRAAESAGRMFPLELSLAVERALSRLTADQREAVLLKVYQGFKFEEMAEILACPVSTIKSRGHPQEAGKSIRYCASTRTCWKRIDSKTRVANALNEVLRKYIAQAAEMNPCEVVDSPARPKDSRRQNSS